MNKVATRNNKTKEKFAFFNKLQVSDIENFYLNKNKENKVGLEYERISLDKNTLKNASYENMAKIIEHFAKIMNWEIIYDKETIIGASAKNNTSISLEPGCQIEISLAPKDDIQEIKKELDEITTLLDKIAQSYNVIFIGYGISPKDRYEEITLLNKERYTVMNNYLPYCPYGEFSPIMMRKTAGIQVNVDFENKKDAYLKLKFLNLIMPFMTGLMANSPIENNKLTQHKTNRAKAWLYTGSARCNFFYKEIFNKKLNKYNNIFKNYIEEILNVPMIYIERNNNIIPINGKINFKKFMEYGYCGFGAKMDDYILHQSLIFPDIRLKKYIEIRNHDSSSPQIALALCAFYKGLLKNNIEYLLKKFNFLHLKEIENYNKFSTLNGLDFNIENINAWEIISMLLNIAKAQLNDSEIIFIRPIEEMIIKKKTQADVLISKNIDNAQKLIDYLYE